jgi:dephospho-CoA kinase
MIRVGLTGSIGMGKSTTAGMFADMGIPVHDADRTVHRLYSGRAVPLVQEAFPGTVVNGVVDRERLSAAVIGKPEQIARLEALIHPLVREEEERFLAENRAAGTPIVVLDIPLLFETGAQDRVDRIVVVTADSEIQRERVLTRPGMTAERFNAILARQVPDEEKRKRADYIVDTSRGLDFARARVAAIVDELRKEAGKAL